MKSLNVGMIGYKLIVFDFEDMNRLKFYDNADPADRHGYRDILVTEAMYPFVGAWRPPSHIIGYEHTFVHTVFDFLKAVVKGRPVAPRFEGGLKDQEVLTAIEKSSKSRRWVKIQTREKS